MREIIISRFWPGRQPVPAEKLHAKLSQWKTGLAPTLTWDDEVPDPSNPFSVSLSVQYSHHLPLIYLGHIRGGEQTCHRDAEEIAEIVDGATHHIPTVVCALVTKAALLAVPHEVYHGIFLAQAAFYERMRSPDKTVARRGRSALNSCQVALQAIQQQQPWTAEDDGHTIGVADGPGVGGMVNANEAGVFNALLGDDRWKGNPIMENLLIYHRSCFCPNRFAIYGLEMKYTNLHGMGHNKPWGLSYPIYPSAPGPVYNARSLPSRLGDPTEAASARLVGCTGFVVSNTAEWTEVDFCWADELGNWPPRA